METITRTYEVYKFSELSEEAREKALIQLYDINVFHDWYRDELDYYATQWEEEYGITFKPEDVCFDLDNRRSLYFHGNSIEVVNQEKFIKYHKLGRQLRYREVRFDFDTHYYGGGDGRTSLEMTIYDDDDIKQRPELDLPVDFDDWFRSICEDLISDLRKQYEYITSEEAIIETIEINDYGFTEDGELFN